MRDRQERGDRTAPQLQQITPADNATGVAVNANLVLTFNEAVKAGSGNFVIRNSADGSIVQSIAVTDASKVSFSGSQVTINPGSDLAPGTSYYVTFASGVVRDLAGNAHAGISSSTAFNFSTSGGVDTTAPVLNSTSPAHNSTGFDIAGNLVLTFSEGIQKGSGDIVLYNLTNGDWLTIDVNDASQVTLADNQLILNPASNLSPHTSYYIMLDAGVVKDYVGNGSAGIAAGVIRFTTNDPVAPVLLASSPTDGETNTGTGVIILVFDEAVRADTGNVQIFRADGTLFNSIDINDTDLVFFSTDGDTVYINPWFGYAENTGYYIIIPAGTLEDLAGNDYAGILSPDGLNFHTPDLTPPQLVSTSSLTDLLPNDTIVLTFDEPVVPTTGDFVIVSTETGQALVYIDAQDTTQVTFDGNTVTIDPIINFEADTVYHVSLLTGPIKDLAGHYYNESFYFTTAASEADAPLLVNTTPTDDSVGVAVDANIVLQFDESIFAGSGAFELRRVSDGGLAESISATDTSRVIIGSDTVTINPSVNLAPSTQYYLTIAPGAVEDVWGNDFAGLLSSSSFNFTTGVASGVVLTGNAQSNTLVGGTGNDVITGLGGPDTLTGGGGSDKFVYSARSESASTTYDTITDFNASADLIDLWFQVTGVDAAITSGTLSETRRFDSELASAVGANKLGVHHAVLFTPDTGGLAGKTFLVIDANGVAGYQGTGDMVILLGAASSLAGLGASDFV